ncbi:MAG: hypothetical protein OEY45_04665 [Gammaproteobacteria bacterium]|nr:hypothetical protein [Gammaproteobacteria bacterium]
MSKTSTLKPLAVAMGAAFVTSLATSPVANAAENPFAMSELSSGYMVADSHMEGKCGEGKCGGEKAKATKEGKCGEGKCGGDKAKKEGKCGGDKDRGCSEEAKAAKEGKCGGDKAKAMKEGKCGEGKCGGNKADDAAPAPAE